MQLLDRRQGSSRKTASRAINLLCGPPRPRYLLSIHLSRRHNMALAAYRNLLRSARIAFQGTDTSLSFENMLTVIGDTHTLMAARAEVRKNFESNRNLRIGSEELQKSLVHAEEVSKFLRENVVQGQAEDPDGKYSMIHTTSLVLGSLD